MAARVDTRHEHRATPFPCSLGVPGAVQGLPKVSISQAIRVNWESHWPVGGGRAEGRRRCVPCEAVAAFGAVHGAAAGCALVGDPGVRGRVPGPGPVPTVTALGVGKL